MQNNKITRNEVTAWFAPDLPFQFGPNGYGLLPGLILQLSSNRVNFYAKKINFDKKIKIKKINAGIKISEEEFESLIYEKSKKLKGLD